MARQFKQVDPIAVGEAQQNLSLQSQSGTAIAEAGQAISGFIDDRAKTRFAEEITEEVTDFEAKHDKYVGRLPGEVSTTRSFTDAQVKELVGNTSDLDKKDAKNLTILLSGINRAANQGKIDTNALAARIEAATRMAIRRRPSLAREFAQIAGLYGGSTMLEDLRQVNAMIGKQTAEQEQLDDFIDEVVAAGGIRADYITDPGKFIIDGYKRLSDQRERDDIMRDYDYKLKTGEVTKFDQSKAFTTTLADAGPQLSRLYNKYLTELGIHSADDLAKQVASGSTKWQELEGTIRALKQKFYGEAFAQFGMLDEDVVRKKIDLLFAGIDGLADANNPSLTAKQSQDIFTAAGHVILNELPGNSRANTRIMMLLGSSNVLGQLSAFDLDPVREMAESSLNGFLSVQAVDYDNPASVRRHTQDIEIQARGDADNYREAKNGEIKKSIEDKYLTPLEKNLERMKRLGGTSSAEDTEQDALVTAYAVDSFLTFVHELDASNQRLPPRAVRRIVNAMSSPEYLASQQALGHKVGVNIPKDEALDSILSGFAWQVQETIKDNTAPIVVIPRAATTGPLNPGREQKLKLDSKLGVNIFVWYDKEHKNKFYYGNQWGDKLVGPWEESMAAQNLLVDMSKVIQSKAHAAANDDYEGAVHRANRQNSKNKFFRVVDYSNAP